MPGAAAGDLIREDYRAYAAHLELARLGALRRAVTLFGRSTFVVVLLFRLSAARWPGVRHVAIVLYKLARLASGIQIPRGTQIGGGLLLPHFGPVVINRRAVLGRQCIVLHNVTLGAKGPSADARVPKIGDGVYLGAGATVLGGVRVGSRATVGANCVVTRDVPDGATAVGNPARILDPRPDP